MGIKERGKLSLKSPFSAYLAYSAVLPVCDMACRLAEGQLPEGLLDNSIPENSNDVGGGGCEEVEPEPVIEID